MVLVDFSYCVLFVVKLLSIEGLLVRGLVRFYLLVLMFCDLVFCVLICWWKLKVLIMKLILLFE